MGKKATKAEMEYRVDRVARLIINCVPRSQILSFAQNEWGVSRPTVDVYVKRARALIREDYEQERQDFLAARLGALDKVVQEAMKSNQLGAVIGAIRLQTELTGSGVNHQK